MKIEIRTPGKFGAEHDLRLDPVVVGISLTDIRQLSAYLIEFLAAYDKSSSEVIGTNVPRLYNMRIATLAGSWVHARQDGDPMTDGICGVRARAIDKAIWTQDAVDCPPCLALMEWRKA